LSSKSNAFVVLEVKEILLSELTILEELGAGNFGVSRFLKNTLMIRVY